MLYVPDVPAIHIYSTNIYYHFGCLLCVVYRKGTMAVISFEISRRQSSRWIHQSPINGYAGVIAFWWLTFQENRPFAPKKRLAFRSAGGSFCLQHFPGPLRAGGSPVSCYHTKMSCWNLRSMVGNTSKQLSYKMAQTSQTSRVSGMLVYSTWMVKSICKTFSKSSKSADTVSMTRNQRLKFSLTSVSAGFFSKIFWPLHVYKALILITPHQLA